mgnify:CR=1 FL=1|tara:strand:- start:153 stop:773 length:621 start_codon:yes stop_codon:yes gene_type:complete
MWYKTQFLEEYLQKNNCKTSEYKKVIDIGAYDCAESLKFTSLFPNASVTAFECNPHLIDKCKVNTNKSDRINLVQKMVTDTPGNTKFNICGGKFNIYNSAQSSLCIPKNEEYRTIDVETIRMDEYLGNSKIDFVWIDVQGAELNVLRSFGSKLKNVSTFYCEVDIMGGRYVSDSTVSTIVDFLNQHRLNLKDARMINPNEFHLIFG